MSNKTSRQRQYFFLIGLVLLASAFLIKAAARGYSSESTAFVGSPVQRQLSPRSTKPAPAPARWRRLIGEYGPDDDILIILERDGRLFALFKRAELDLLVERSKNIFLIAPESKRAGQRLLFTRDSLGRATQVELAKVAFQRRP